MRQKFTLAPPPIRDRMVDENGIATRPYQVWLSLASLALGAPADLEVLQAFNQDAPDVSGPLQDATIEALTASQADPSAAAVEEIQQLTQQDAPNVGDLRQIVEDLQRMQQQMPGTASPLTARMDALEILVASMSEGRGTDEAKVICDTHANRVNYSPVQYDEWLYYETNPTYTDRQVLYIATGGYWKYLAGIMAGSINTPSDTKPTDLSGQDFGFLFYAGDFEQLYRWDGAAWHYAPGCSSQYIVAGYPQGGLWWPCDGATYTCSQDNGTVASVTTPNLLGDVFIKGAASTGAVQVATRPTWEATAKTADESTHVHDVDPAVVASAASLSSVAVAAGSDYNVTPDSHTHNVDVANTTSTSGTAHSHALTDAASQLKVPSETNGGLPKRIALSWYMRR